MVEMILDKRDSRLLDIHGALYPFVKYGTTGSEWYITSPDYDEHFKTYKAFIRFVEDEVKESLLTYVINDELKELMEALI